MQMQMQLVQAVSQPLARLQPEQAKKVPEQARLQLEQARNWAALQLQQHRQALALV